MSEERSARLKARLEAEGLHVWRTTRYGNDTGSALWVSNGALVMVPDAEDVEIAVQGREPAAVEAVLRRHGFFDGAEDTAPGPTLPEGTWEIGLTPRAWPDPADEQRLGRLRVVLQCLAPTDPERMTLLALLLEAVGVEQAVRLGSPEVWRTAVAGLSRRQ